MDSYEFLVMVAACLFGVCCSLDAVRLRFKLRKVQQIQFQALYDESLQHWEREKYRDKVSELELENQLLKSSLIATQSGSKGSKEILKENQRLQHELESSQSREQSFRQQIEGLNHAMEDYKKALKQAEAENTKLMHSVHEERNRSQQSIEPLVRRTQKTEEALEKTKKQCKKLEEDWTALNRLRDDLDRQLKNSNHTVEGALAENKRLKDEISMQIQAQTALKSQIANLQNQLSDEIRCQKPLKKQLQEVTDRLLSAESRRKELEDLVSKDSQMAALSSMLEAERNRNETLEAEFRSFSKARDEDERTRECVVCLAAQKSVMFEPCRHCCTCRECGIRLSECPLCKKPIRRRKHVFV